MIKSTLFLILFLLSNIDAADTASHYKEICANCHGDDGMANDAFMSIALKSVSDIVKDLKGYRDSELDKYGMGIVMTGRVEKMSNEDILKMAEYVHSLKK